MQIKLKGDENWVKRAKVLKQKAQDIYVCLSDGIMTEID